MNHLLTKAPGIAPGIASPLHVRFTPASPGRNPRLVRKTFLKTMLAVTISVLAPIAVHASSATWDLNPGSGDWNTAANWTPATVPNGSADTATFDLSNTTNVSISANTEVNGITFTSAATNPYGITASPGFTLTLSGTGITNNSGIGQGLGAESSQFEGGQILFTNSANAGNAGIFIDGEYGVLQFSNRSTAGSANISNLGGSINFFNSSTADTANISLEGTGSTNFFNTSTAGSANIGSDGGGFMFFFDNSTAGSAF
jgi:hypothetical protein